MSIDEATPAEWDRLRNNFPPLERDGWANSAESDPVDHPAHYTKGGYGKIECIEAIEESMTKEAFWGYLKGNCVKYLWRYEDKKRAEDLKKCQWYLRKLLESYG